MSNAFDGLRDLVYGSTFEQEQKSGALTLHDLDRLLVSLYQTASAPAASSDDRFYEMHFCEEHKDCYIIKPCTWNGPTGSEHHMKQSEWLQAVELSDWRRIPIEEARRMGYKG